MENLNREKQLKIEQVIEDITTQKYESIAEIKANFEFMIKRLETAKQKEKAENKKKERETEIKKMQDEMEVLKKKRIEEINLEFEER